MSHGGGIWVGPLLSSSKDIAQNTQETFDGVSSAVKTYLGYLCFILCRTWTRLSNERSLSSSNTIWSLSTISMAAMYIFFSISKCGSPVESATLPVTINCLSALLAWKGQNHGRRVNLQLLRSYKNVSEHKHIHRKIRFFASFLPIDRMYTENLIEDLVGT